MLAQSGSNYIDNITAVFLLICLYSSVLYYKENKPIDLYMAGVTAGLLIGMKYNMIIYILGFQAFIAHSIIKSRSLRLFLNYAAITTVVGSYWYARNLLVFGNPIFPMNIHSKGMGIFPSSGFHSLWQSIADNTFKFILLFKDTAANTLNGGYGAVFWGIAFSCLIFSTYIGIKDAVKFKKPFLLILSLQSVIGFASIVLVPLRAALWVPRYIIHVLCLSLIAFAMVIDILDKEQSIYLKNTLKSAAIAFSLMAIIMLSVVQLPNYDISKPIEDFLNKTQTSEYNYLRLTRPHQPNVEFIWKSLSYVWEALDYITAKQGLTCYIAIDKSMYFISPFYGSKLQNKVWNFNDNLKPDPNCFIYYSTDKGQPLYIKKEIPMNNTILNRQNMLILKEEQAFLIINSDFLNDETNKNKLADYYLRTFPVSVELSRLLQNNLKEPLPLIIHPEAGYGFKHKELIGELKNKVHLVPKQLHERFAHKNITGPFYSFFNPVEGFHYEKISDTTIENLTISLYRNY
ncbi:membrane protein [Candidatus Magnetoovum chiemensis]|nr:membrane protein [Candidatus Magnetoovum chiemensis]